MKVKQGLVGICKRIRGVGRESREGNVGWISSNYVICIYENVTMKPISLYSYYVLIK
jgi:hypothetical protein